MRLWISKAVAGKMRNMSKIPKLQADTKRSSCCSVKVAAHNKEVCESVLTLQKIALLRCCRHTLPLLTLWFYKADMLCESRLFPRREIKITVFDRKKAECQVWVWYEINARTGTHRGVATKHAHTQKFCGSQRKLLPWHQPVIQRVGGMIWKGCVVFFSLSKDTFKQLCLRF